MLVGIILIVLIIIVLISKHSFREAAGGKRHCPRCGKEITLGVGGTYYCSTCKTHYS